MPRPNPTEYTESYKVYIDLVQENEVLDALTNSYSEASQFFRTLPPEMWKHAYAPGKWTIAELAVHLNDAERVFAYRALRFSREDKTELPGYDHDLYVEKANVSLRFPQGILAEMNAIRESTLWLYKSFNQAALARTGTANNKQVSVNALGFIIAGHQLHHLQVIREKYLVKIS